MALVVLFLHFNSALIWREQREKEMREIESSVTIYIRVCHQTLGPKIINLQLSNSEDMGPE